MKTVQPQLPELIDQLVKVIEQAIIHALPNIANISEEWNDPEIWRGITRELRSFKERVDNISDLANIFVGLSKYFDFYSLEWAKQEDIEKINKLVFEIVNVSMTLMKANKISSSTPCGQHEDKACCIAPHSKRWRGKILFYKDKKLSLPKTEACNFIPKPRAIKLEKAIKIYRVIGKKNKPHGSYWLNRISIFTTKTEWRSKAAVLKKWNPDDGYVELELAKDTIIWCGKAASQQVPKELCILRGGGNQIWIPGCTMNQLKNRVTGRKITPW